MWALGALWLWLHVSRLHPDVAMFSREALPPAIAWPLAWVTAVLYIATAVTLLADFGFVMHAFFSKYDCPKSGE